jgi:hypothetical protein
VDAMINTRQETRTISSEKCEIKKGASVYECWLEDISSSGAKVTCFGFLQEIWPRDKCILHLYNGSDMLCHVKHIAASNIGLRFNRIKNN